MRIRKHWSQSQLADAFGTHRNTVNRWEMATDKSHAPVTLIQFVYLCDIFGRDASLAIQDIIRQRVILRNTQKRHSDIKGLIGSADNERDEPLTEEEIQEMANGQEENLCVD